MLKFVLILTTWASGDVFALNTSLTGADCIARLEAAHQNDLQELGNLTCEVEVEHYAAD